MNAASDLAQLDDARGQIDEALLSYCRGIDRLDGDAVLAAFHPGAVLEDYGAEPMTIEAFVQYALGSLERKFTATQHRISNTRVEFGSDDDSGAPSRPLVENGSETNPNRPSLVEEALVETYVLAFHVEPAEGGDLLHTFNGRYIDRFTCVDGVWKIARRTLRNDWSQVAPLDRRMSGAWTASGRAGSPDPLDG